MIIAPHHINYVVSDMDVSLGFFTRALKLEIVQDAIRENLSSYDEMFGAKNIRLRVALLQLPQLSLFLELFEMLNPPGQKRSQEFNWVGVSHLAFQVSNMDAEYARIQQLGYRFRSSPVDVWRDGKFIARGCYLLDPDGTVIELFELDAARSQMVMPRAENRLINEVKT